jgi:hypothetical protein
MFRFRPTVETLDARTLPSAVFASSDDPIPVAQTVQLADASGDGAALEAVVYEARRTPKPPPPPPPPSTSEIPVTKDSDISTTGL